MPALATAPAVLRLEEISKPALTTREAAHFLNRQPTTLQYWAAMDCGPIRPMRVGGRLMWRTADVKRLLGLPV